MVTFRTAAIATAAVALAVPAGAQAKSRSMLAGPPNATQKALGQVTSVNAFFPTKLTINVGDTVNFSVSGFHTIDIPRKGGSDLPLILPTGQKVSGAVDAAGAPFWFNGQDVLGFNPAVATVNNFGKSFTYNGTKRIESGFPPNTVKPMKVKFTKAGVFKIFCDVHPGMSATVDVLRKGAAVPSSAQVKASVAKQSKAAIKAAKGLANTNPGADTIDVGVGAKGGVEFFGMAPSTLTVPAGTTVKFQMSKRSLETHTATFGPGNPLTEPSSYLGALSAGFQTGALNPQAVYPSDVTPVSISPTLHGNGFWNSGAMDNDPTTPLPSSATVKFSTPGTYTFFCLIHPFMTGTVIVQ